MKIKLVTLLSALFFVCSLTSRAHHMLLCNGGQAYMVTYFTDENGVNHWTTISTAGGCVGDWSEPLDRVIAAGNPVHGEISTAAYTALSNIASGTTPTTEEKNMIDELLAEVSPTTGWVNPLVLNEDAYNAVYSGTSYLDIFYVATSYNISSSQYNLTLYSDDDRKIIVTYTDIYSSVVGSEEIVITKGYNCKPLGTSSLDKGFYTVSVATDKSIVPVSLSID